MLKSWLFFEKSWWSSADAPCTFLSMKFSLFRIFLLVKGLDILFPPLVFVSVAPVFRSLHFFRTSGVCHDTPYNSLSKRWSASLRILMGDCDFGGVFGVSASSTLTFGGRGVLSLSNCNFLGLDFGVCADPCSLFESEIMHISDIRFVTLSSGVLSLGELVLKRPDDDWWELLHSDEESLGVATCMRIWNLAEILTTGVRFEDFEAKVIWY